jgi:hypothetical protein
MPRVVKLLKLREGLEVHIKSDRDDNEQVGFYIPLTLLLLRLGFSTEYVATLEQSISEKLLEFRCDDLKIILPGVDDGITLTKFVQSGDNN